MAAAKKLVRGAALVKKAIEAKPVEGAEPVEAGILKKLRLPNDEKLSAGLKAYFAHDALGFSFDDEEPEFEPMTLDELVAQEFSDDAVPEFGEAIELLSDDCVLFEGEGDEKSFLYVGTPDDAGEYPVITLTHGEGAKVSGFVPFDVWIAQRAGVPLSEDYAALSKALAESNGDGRVAFDSERREISAEKDDEDEDEDGDEEV